METNVAMVVEGFIAGALLMTIVMYLFGGKIRREADRVKRDLDRLVNIAKSTKSLKDVKDAAEKVKEVMH